MVNYVIFGYVLALAARHRDQLTVIDYGGNLGDYYWIGKALLPGVELEYHCKELPEVAAAGRLLTPDVIWHTDDTCLAASYDLVDVLLAACPTCTTGRTVFGRAAQATRHYLFSRCPRYGTCRRMSSPSVLEG